MEAQSTNHDRRGWPLGNLRLNARNALEHSGGAPYPTHRLLSPLVGKQLPARQKPRRRHTMPLLRQTTPQEPRTELRRRRPGSRPHRRHQAPRPEPRRPPTPPHLQPQPRRRPRRALTTTGDRHHPGEHTGRPHRMGLARVAHPLHVGAATPLHVENENQKTSES